LPIEVEPDPEVVLKEKLKNLKKINLYERNPYLYYINEKQKGYLFVLTPHRKNFGAFAMEMKEED